MDCNPIEAFLQVNSLIPWSRRLHVIDYFCCRLVCKAWRLHLTREEEIQLIKKLLNGYTIQFMPQVYTGLLQLAYRSNERDEISSEPIDRARPDGLYKGLCPHLCWETEFGPTWTFNWEMSKGYQRIRGIEEPSAEYQLGIVAIECRVSAGVQLECTITIGGQNTFFVVREEPRNFDRTLTFKLFEMPLIITQHRLGYHSIQVTSNAPFLLQLVKERVNPILQSQQVLFYVTRSPYVLNKCCLFQNIKGMMGALWWALPSVDVE